MLKPALQKAKIRYRDLGNAVGVSAATISQIVNHDIYPKNFDRENFKNKTLELLKASGVDIPFFWHQPNDPAFKAQQKILSNPSKSERIAMLAKQKLSTEARAHFKLRGAVFCEPQNQKEVFKSRNFEFARAAMIDAAVNGRFIAIIGQSGAGKTLLRRELQEEVSRATVSGTQIQLIEPSVVGMSQNDNAGKAMKSAVITNAILYTVAEGETPKRDQEARHRQLYRVLKSSRAANFRNTLVIEEAHDLSKPTLKHLKRFLEMENGYQKLLGVVLIGQPELLATLSVTNYDVREVTARCEQVVLMPFDREELESYLRFKCDLAGIALDKLMDAGTIDAIEKRLSPANIIGLTPQALAKTSMLYPLHIDNLVTAALNLACGKYKAPHLTANIIQKVTN